MRCHVRMTRTMLFMPLAYASTLDRREPSYVEAFWSPSLGISPLKAHAKADAIVPALIKRQRAEESFSLRRGLECSYVFFKLGITSGLVDLSAKQRRRPGGSPSIPVAIQGWS